MHRSFKRQSILLLALCGMSAPAFAAQDQSTNGTSTAQPETPAVPAPVLRAADEPASGLEDIVVTATRREARLQDVPVTVTALTNQSLTSADVTTVRSLAQVVPGFIGSRNQGVFQPVIRGVGSTGISVGDEPNIATYIDGVYYPEAFANFIDLVEVERVEVLRGPQGTTFGRNATGGLVNVITPDPSFDFRGRAAFSRLLKKSVARSFGT